MSAKRGRRAPATPRSRVTKLAGDTIRILAADLKILRARQAEMVRLDEERGAAGFDKDLSSAIATHSRAVAGLHAEIRKAEEADAARIENMTQEQKVAALRQYVLDLPAELRSKLLRELAEATSKRSVL